MHPASDLHPVQGHEPEQGVPVLNHTLLLNKLQPRPNLQQRLESIRGGNVRSGVVVSKWEGR